MAYNRWYIDLEGADNAAFSVGAITKRVYVTVADPDSEFLGELKEYYEYIKRRSRGGRRHVFNIDVYGLTVKPSEWDGADFEQIMYVLSKDFLRMTETNVTRLLELYAGTSGYSETELDDYGFESIFPLEVAYVSHSKALNEEESRNELTLQLVSVYPAA